MQHWNRLGGREVEKQRKDGGDEAERVRDRRKKQKTVATLAGVFAFERLHQVDLQSLLLWLVSQSLNTPVWEETKREEPSASTRRGENGKSVPERQKHGKFKSKVRQANSCVESRGWRICSHTLMSGHCKATVGYLTACSGIMGFTSDTSCSRFHYRLHLVERRYFKMKWRIKCANKKNLMFHSICLKGIIQQTATENNHLLSNYSSLMFPWIEDGNCFSHIEQAGLQQQKHHNYCSRTAAIIQQCTQCNASPLKPLNTSIDPRVYGTVSMRCG